jgi:DNA-binding NarL/FixJ family response regulator
MKPTALVVDDDHDILEMTALFLENNGVKVVAKAETGESALEHLRKRRPNFAVMDVLLPGADGLELLATIRRERLPTRTILVTGFHRDEWLFQALELGVEAYLIKPHVPGLELALKALSSGNRYFCPWATEFVVTDYLRLKAKATTPLTSRELDVLARRKRGKSVKEIAAELDISPKTVEKNVTNLRKKFGPAFQSIPGTLQR